MRVQFELTQGTKQLTQAQRQPLDQVIDVSAFDALDLQLVIRRCVFPQQANVYGAAVIILTSMQNDDETGWVTLCSFPPAFEANATALRTVRGGILKYIRWSVPVLAPSSLFIFSIVGQGNMVSTLEGGY